MFHDVPSCTWSSVGKVGGVLGRPPQLVFLRSCFLENMTLKCMARLVGSSLFGFLGQTRLGIQAVGGPPNE